MEPKLFKYNVKTLTPLHIGDGDNYDSLRYLLDPHGSRIFLIDFDLAEVLSPEQIMCFMEWIRHAEYPNWHKFFRDGLKDLRLFQVMQRKCSQVRSLSAEKPQGNIACFIKTGQQPYIPGTVLKGGIRTALLYYAIKKQKGLVEFLLTRLEQFGQKHSAKIAQVKNRSNPPPYIKRELAKELQKLTQVLERKVFLAAGYDASKFDAKYDLLRGLAIVDTQPVGTDSLFIGMVDILGTNRRGGLHELCEEDISFPGTEFRLAPVKHLEQLGFSRSQVELMQIPVVLKACYLFTKVLLEAEIEYYKKHGQGFVAQKLEGIAKENQLDSPMLRIGKHEGFLGTTMALAIKEIDPKLYHEVYIHAGKGKSYSYEYPKTRKVLRRNGQYETLGWIKIIPEEANTRADTSKEQKGQDVTEEMLLKLQKKYNQN